MPVREKRLLVCAHCGEAFEPPDDERWNDEKALAELEATFPRMIMRQ